MKAIFILTKYSLVFVVIGMGVVNFTSWKENFLSGNLVEAPIFKIINLASRDKLNRSYVSNANGYLHSNRFSVRGDDIELKIPFRGVGIGHVDAVNISGFEASFSGWAYLRAKDDWINGVVIVFDDRVIGFTPIGRLRGDVAAALNDSYAANTGFSSVIKLENEIDKCQLKFYALTQSLEIWRINYNCN